MRSVIAEETAFHGDQFNVFIVKCKPILAGMRENERTLLLWNYEFRREKSIYDDL